MPIIADRRQTFRRKPDRLAYVKIEPDNGGAVVDVCECGLGFQVIAAVDTTGPVSFWISIDASSRIEAVGKVTWTDDTKRLGGLRFTHMSEEDRELLRGWFALPDPRPMSSKYPPPAISRDVPPAPRTRIINPAPVASPPASRAPEAPTWKIGPPRITNASPELAPYEYPRITSRLLNPPPPPVPSRAANVLATLALVVVLLGFGAFLVYGYHREVGAAIIRLGIAMQGDTANGDVAPATAASPNTNPPAAGAPADDSSSAAGPALSPAPVEEPSSTTPAAAARIPATSKTQLAPTTSTASDASNNSQSVPTSNSASGASANSLQDDAGELELAMARQYLRGTNGASDARQAVQWLWSAVEKGNTRAEVALADLYVRGDGVAKNCDQGRVLLLAASRKGSVEAAQKLADWNASTCGTPSKP